MVVLKRAFVALAVAALFLPAAASFSSDGKVIVYYFHGNFRCPTCRAMEQYAKEAVEENFKKELDSGRLEFRPVNVEEKGNEHFADDYGLYAKTLIISKTVNGREEKYKNLTKIWEYVRNKGAFMDYVTQEISEYLKE